MEHHHHQHHAGVNSGEPSIPSLSASTSGSKMVAQDFQGLSRPQSPGMAGMGAGMHMQMSFYWGPDVTILFPGWTSHTWGQYALALLFCFGLTLSLELLGWCRQRVVARVKAQHRGRHTGSRVPRSPPPDSISMPMLESTAPTALPSADRLILSAVLCCSAGLSYLVMLLVMSFNVGVFLAVVAGHFVGVYLFGASRLLGEEAAAGEAGCHS